jgi:hypothetical protein
VVVLKSLEYLAETWLEAAIERESCRCRRGGHKQEEKRFHRQFCHFRASANRSFQDSVLASKILLTIFFTSCV